MYSLWVVIVAIQMCVIFAVFNDFVNNEGAMNLVRQYLNKKIKTLNDLHTSLWNSGIKLSPRTIKTYTTRIKVKL